MDSATVWIRPAPKKKGRRKALIVSSTLAVVMFSTIVFAQWLTQGTGPGYVRAGQTQGLVVLDQAPANIVGNCFPGQDCAVSIKVTNPNPSAVTITNADFGNQSSSVGNCVFEMVFTNQGGLNLGPIPAGGTSVLLIPNAAHMTAQIPSLCQGALWTVSTTLTGSV